MRRIGSSSTERRGIAAALATALLLLACSRGGAVRTAPPRASDPGPAIRSLLLTSAGAWNRGDLDGFLKPYLQSDSTTFVGSTGLIHGVTEMREHYRAAYFSHGRPPFTLQFRNMSVRPLGRNYALAVGEYVLTDRTTGKPGDHGIFSLTFERTPAGWRIIHDHSSSLARH